MTCTSCSTQTDRDGISGGPDTPASYYSVPLVSGTMVLSRVSYVGWLNPANCAPGVQTGGTVMPGGSLGLTVDTVG